MSNSTYSILRNILSNYLGAGVGFVVTFFLTPFLIHRLGNIAFGIWILVNSFRQYFQLLEFGTNPAIIKLVAEYAAKGIKNKINEIASSSFIIFLLFGLLSINLSLALAFYGLGYFQIPSSYQATTRLLIIILGITISFLLVKRGLNAILAGYHRFDLINLISVIGELTQAVMTVILVMQGFGLISLALLMLGTNLLEITLLFYCLKKSYSVTIAFSFISEKMVREIFGFSIYTFITDIANRVAWNIDVLIIGYFLPVSYITVYTVGVRLARIPEKLLNPLVNTFFPLASAWDAQQEKQLLQRLMLEGTKVSLLLLLPTASLIFVTGNSLISLWVGKEYLSSLSILEIFLVIFVVDNMLSTANRVQLGMKKLRFNTIVCFLSALSNLILSIILIPYYGIIGVALGSLIPNLVANIFLSIPYTCSILQLPLRRLLTYSILPPFIPLLVPGSVIYLASSYGEQLSDPMKIILTSTVFLSLYIFIYLKFFASPEERQILLKALGPSA
jgi:O-antigen/teichoic acid export membrane protein